LILLGGLLIVAVVASRSLITPKGKRAIKRNKKAMDIEDRGEVTDGLVVAPVVNYAADQNNANRDGVISRDEYNRRLSLFDQLDTDGDGFLTREEYARLSLFDQLDTNHDGVLTREELARFR